jgi:transposase InsO family protein
MTRMKPVMTDNHFSHRLSHAVQATLEALGANHVPIRPRCPLENGEVERLNRTLYVLPT